MMQYPYPYLSCRYVVVLGMDSVMFSFWPLVISHFVGYLTEVNK